MVDIVSTNSEINVYVNDGAITLTTTVETDGIVSATLTNEGLRGLPGLQWLGVYDNASSYTAGDVVYFNASAYIATGVITAGGLEPDSHPNFSLLSQGHPDVTEHNNLPAGTLQDALEYLEDKQFVQGTTPVGITLNEGDVWYDTSTDRLLVYRDSAWETIVTGGATADSAGYDDITMNGGYF